MFLNRQRRRYSTSSQALPSSGEIASSVKDWFLSSKGSTCSSSSLPEQIYSHLSQNLPLSSFPNLRLSEPLVLRVLSHRPHSSSSASSPSDLLLLRIRFFSQSSSSSFYPYRHSRSAYHAFFRLLPTTHLESYLSSSLLLHNSHHRLNDTLVLGYSLASRPDLALHHLSSMRFNGLDLDYFTYHVLFNSLVDSRLYDHADSILRQIRSNGHASPVTDCIHLKRLCNQNRIDEALHHLLSTTNHVVADRTVAMLVRALCRKSRFEDAERLVNTYKNDEAYGVWVAGLISSGRLDAAVEFLRGKKLEEDYVPEDGHYGKLVSLWLGRNRLDRVYDVMVEMIEEGIPPGKETMNAVLCFFCKAGMVDVAVHLYRSRQEFGLTPNLWVYNHMIGALCRNGNLEEVYEVLSESIQQGYFPGRQTFNILVTTLCRDGDHENLMKLLDGALERNIKPATSVVARCIASLCKAGEMEAACLVPQMVGRGLGRYKHTYTNLIQACTKVGNLEVLPKLVIGMQEHGHVISRFLYQSVVRSLCEAERFQDVEDLLNKQLELLNILDARTVYNYFIEGASRANKLEIVETIRSYMIGAGVHPNLDTKIITLTGYLKSKKISDALTYFSNLVKEKESDTDKAVSTKLYNIFILGLCEAGKVDYAVMFWQKMREKKLIPSLQCYEDLVLALCNVRKYDAVFELLDDFTLVGRKVSTFICNVFLLHTLKSLELLNTWYVHSKDFDQMFLGQLIDEFSHRLRSRENLENLEEVAEKYFKPDIYTYNILLRGLTMVGHMECACSLFEKIEKKGCEPNRWTYDIIVHGYCRQGNRRDADTWLKRMDKFRFKPSWYTIKRYSDTK